MNKKSIIFGMPETFKISDEIHKNLEFCRYKVINVSFPQEFKYKNNWQKVYNFLRKSILNDTEYKAKLRFEKYRNAFEEKLNLMSQKADYAFFIRPDFFPKDFIELVKSKTNVMIGYQFDALKIFPAIKNYIPYFDRFFVFDPSDVSGKLLPATNFYFDFRKNEFSKNTLNNTKNIYFVGSFIKNRADVICKILPYIEEYGFENNIQLVLSGKKYSKKYRNTPLNLSQHTISFEENLINIQNATILIDFVNGKHNGLSFRTFEAIGYGKKLITTNADVKKYDFYHPNNFFVLENENYAELKSFLELSYLEPSEEIKEKYGFSNWIRYILDIEPHQKIGLPKVN